MLDSIATRPAQYNSKTPVKPAFGSIKVDTDTLKKLDNYLTNGDFSKNVIKNVNEVVRDFIPGVGGRKKTGFKLDLSNKNQIGFSFYPNRLIRKNKEFSHKLRLKEQFDTGSYAEMINIDDDKTANNINFLKKDITENFKKTPPLKAVKNFFENIAGVIELLGEGLGEDTRNFQKNLNNLIKNNRVK